MRYLATVEYNGTNFCGWQKQITSNLPSIQSEIEKVISKILNKKISIAGSGRTDAGVHALAQTFHFDSDKKIDSRKFIHGFNELISKDIVLTSIKEVSEEFHARFSAKFKVYFYRIENSKFNSPFNKDFALQLHQNLDVKKMKECAKLFVGKHNFQNFTSKKDDDYNFVRFIERISFRQNGDFLEIELKGNGFMRYMVRMIVGNLIMVGLGKISKEEIEAELKSKTRKTTSYKAPAKGLYLKKVIY